MFLTVRWTDGYDANTRGPRTVACVASSGGLPGRLIVCIAATEAVSVCQQDHGNDV